MSRDIRSFFKVVSTKNSDQKHVPKQKKTAALIDSDNDDFVNDTPEKPSSKRASASKRRAQVLSSDSEDESKVKTKALLEKKLQKVEEQSKLKPVNLDAFNKTITQSKVEHVPKLETSKSNDKNKHKGKEAKKKNSEKGKNKKNTEIGIHEDKNFEKTLQELDEDSDDTILLDNLDFLDKTLEAVACEDKKLEKKDKQLEATDRKQGKEQNQLEKHKRDKERHDEKAIEGEGTPKRAEKRQRKNSESTPTLKKKPKLEHTDSGIDPDQDKWEKKRYSAGLYQAYLHRPEPKNLGQKVYPKGNPNCLTGLTFLRTGVLDSIDGEDFLKLVTDHSGRVVHSVSKKVNYLVVGEEPGPAKLAKARNYKIPELSEDQFLDLILEKSGLKPKYAVKNSESEDFGLGSSENGSEELIDISLVKEEETSHTKAKMENVVKQEASKNKIIPKEVKTELKESNLPVLDLRPAVTKNNPVPNENLCWTEKYKPSTIKDIIGQQDGNSNMNRLKTWLANWFKNQEPARRKLLPKVGAFGRTVYKAALLSGPPGVGKTTTATLVAKELGFDIVEFNASDTRNKKLLHEEISYMMKSKTVAGFASGEKNMNKKRVLLMDEVDGMAGNEDRGGIAELISFIKSSNFPIICMCNNREDRKLTTLATYCYDLRFGRPNVTQILNAMATICTKEGLNIQPEALTQLVSGTRCDIRQTLNHLAMWSASNKVISMDTVRKESKNSQKDVVVGVWDVAKTVLTKNLNRHMSLSDKERLFFYDYSMGPLFVQENFGVIDPECTDSTHNNFEEGLLRYLYTTDSISLSDLIETKIRSTNNWSLLNVQAYYSTVMPSFYVSGKLRTPVPNELPPRFSFPQWFGMNSRRNKILRIVNELYSHAKMSISGDKDAIQYEYAEILGQSMLLPLLKNGSEGALVTLEIMKAYSLLREDMINLFELLNHYEKPKKPNPYEQLSVPVKAALTRLYNKKMSFCFAPPVASKKKSRTGDGEGELPVEEEEEYFSDEEETTDNVSEDNLIKVKTKEASKAGGRKASTSKQQTKTKTSKASESKSSKGKTNKPPAKAKK